MFSASLAKFLVKNLTKYQYAQQIRRCHSILGLKDLIVSDRPEFTLHQVQPEHQAAAIEMLKQHYLTEHVLVRARRMDLKNDCAVDEYLVSLIKQGNTIFAKSEDNKLAGICVGFASSPVDARNLRTYAFYRQVCIPKQNNPKDVKTEYEQIAIQDPNTKDFLYFTAKLQETPNLWDTFKQPKIFEIKMLAVVPEFRRMGLATSMVEASKNQAQDQGFHVVRMDCINPYDYKVAERCMLHCIVKFPLHRLRGAHAPFVKRSSPHNCCVRVYVASRPQADTPDIKEIKDKQRELEALIE